MKKLSNLFACAAMSLTLGVAGCKKKKEGDAAKTTDTPAAKTTDKAAPVAATGDLPAECADYKGMIEKLASCEKLPPQSRDALKAGFDQMSASWKDVGAMPAEAKAQMATACKTGADALKQTAAAACGW